MFRGECGLDLGVSGEEGVRVVKGLSDKDAQECRGHDQGVDEAVW